MALPPYITRRLSTPGPEGPAGDEGPEGPQGQQGVPGPTSPALNNTPVGTPSFVIDAEAGNAVTVHVQLRDGTGADLTRRGVAWMYLSSDASGDVPLDAGGADVLPSAGTDGAMLLGTDAAAEEVQVFAMVSESDGDIDVVLSNSGDANVSVYLNVISALGVLTTSGAVSFVDNTP